MRIIEKKYMFNQCLYTLIQNGPDLYMQVTILSISLSGVTPPSQDEE